MRFFPAFCSVFLFILGVSCAPEQEIKNFSFSYLFADSASGWTADFADYPLDSTGYQLHFKHDTLPYVINPDSSRYSLKLSGTNKNGNGLFMFVKRKISGLKPNTPYEVLLNVRLASKDPISNNSLDDTSGELVYLKFGALTAEPESILIDNYHTVNFDKGTGAVGGENVMLAGNLGVATTTKYYTFITRNGGNNNFVRATSDDQGSMWLMVGTDSRFGGRTIVYYTQIDAYLNQADD